MSLLFALLLLACLAALVLIPLRRPAQDPGEAEASNDREELHAELLELEARKEARYREIRDAESDHAAGKIDQDDFDRLIAELKVEAAEVLERIDRVRESLQRLGPSG